MPERDRRRGRLRAAGAAADPLCLRQPQIRSECARTLTTGGGVLPRDGHRSARRPCSAAGGRPMSRPRPSIGGSRSSRAPSPIVAFGRLFYRGRDAIKLAETETLEWRSVARWSRRGLQARGTPRPTRGQTCARAPIWSWPCAPQRIRRRRGRGHLSSCGSFATLLDVLVDAVTGAVESGRSMFVWRWLGVRALEG